MRAGGEIGEEVPGMGQKLFTTPCTKTGPQVTAFCGQVLGVGRGKGPFEAVRRGKASGIASKGHRSRRANAR